MATIVLSAAGLALGSSFGGTVLGLSAATIGRAAGATLGRVIDQRILGSGSEAVETGRVDRFRLTGASEGATVQQIYGRMRVAGQVIWATRFLESSKTSGGGKGAGPQPKTSEFSYSVSLAVALCEGPITRVGRVWADGVEVSQDDLNLRIYHGDKDQQPDPKIIATEGVNNAPAYRGVAYVVFEDLPLDQFGNRVPQFTFEIMCPSAPDATSDVADLARQVKAVAMIPGTGEYSLSTKPAYLSAEYGEKVAINVNSPAGGTDFTTSLDALSEELPNCGSVSLVVSWFGSDLRCETCKVAPKVEQKEAEADGMPWSVAGLTRQTASIVPQVDDRPVYGGTPDDASVVQAIQALKASGQKPMFYPFILMEQLAGNTLTDPWSGNSSQPVLPWRGRITLSSAPGQSGSPDGTSAATSQVLAFLGTAALSDFEIVGEKVIYSGPAAWGYRRFILHYAHLCAAAGGVDAFCIGSEMVALTQIRGAGDSFPAVEALRQLAGEVRSVLGSECKISYAADWSEYHGYQPVGTADKFFHLDSLWADPNIDFIGIDNYMPLSDWRDSNAHLDDKAGSIYNLDYLAENVAGGEGFDWFYHSNTARNAQIRTPITDSEGEPWVWRYKDLSGWWGNQHHNRIGGIRQRTATEWTPQSKPIWFTELGCAAIDKGTNQPNKFLDPKSSESQLPYYSNGMRDDFMQMQYMRAIWRHFEEAENNPNSETYNAPMVAMDRAHVWAWDARPYPFFPGNAQLWSDGDNYARGHWLNGRTSSRTLASVVAEICTRSGVTQYDVSRLYGLVRGYSVDDLGSARAALQPLIVTFGIEVAERDGALVFTNRTGRPLLTLDEDTLALDPEQGTAVTATRAPEAEIAGRVQFEYLDVDGNYTADVAEAIHPKDAGGSVARSAFPLALTKSEADRVVSRWMSEARTAQDTVTFALPPSQTTLGAGDVVQLLIGDIKGAYRIDRIEESGLRIVEATRIAAEVYKPFQTAENPPVLKPHVGPVPVELLFLDLPLMTGDEAPHAPHVAVCGRPWPGSIALYSAPLDSNYVLQDLLNRAATMGVTQTPLVRQSPALWDRQAQLEVKLIQGALTAASIQDVLSGANTFAIGDGTPDNWEIVQFAQSKPLGNRRFGVSRLLRGQSGSAGLIPDVWPAGSRIVMLDGTPEQVVMPTAARGTRRHFRYGPARRPISDPSFIYTNAVFAGNGLRPYPVAHLRSKDENGDASITWLRQTRIGGDDWSTPDVPLGEESEIYLLKVSQGGVVRREEMLAGPSFLYPLAQQIEDFGGGAFKVQVAQVSAQFGEGSVQTLSVG